MIDPAPPLPQGLSPFHRWCQWVTRMIMSMRVMDRSATEVHRTTRGVMIAGGGPGRLLDADRWAAVGRVYDMTKSYRGTIRAGEHVWLPPDNIAVTSGVIDPDSGEQVYSVPGFWLALQSIGPVKDPLGLPAGTYYHIPQWPMPAQANLDDPSNFWFLISPYNVCT